MFAPGPPMFMDEALLALFVVLTEGELVEDVEEFVFVPEVSFVDADEFVVVDPMIVLEGVVVVSV